jgi:hypothetical protein
MKKIFSLFILFAAMAVAHVQAQQQDWAVGLRFGDPSGLNGKKYFGNGTAFDLTVGSSGNFYGGRSRGYRDGYRGAGIALMGNYVWQKEVGFIELDGLEWYYGVGGQLSFRRYFAYDRSRASYYDYQTNVAIGATGLVGLEYFIPDTPISIFGDIGIYLEIVPAPFWINLPVGIGGRFNF